MPISVNFIGNRPVLWEPTAPGDPSSSAVPNTAPPLNNDSLGVVGSMEDDSLIPETNEELRQRFIAFLRTELDMLQRCPNDHRIHVFSNGEKDDLAKLKMGIATLLNLVLDPTTDIEGLTTIDALRSASRRSKFSVKNFFAKILYTFVHQLSGATTYWLTNAVRKANTEGSGIRREAADCKAQQQVPTWYEGRCVLSGAVEPHGAHIVPVRAKGAEHSETWDLLCCFWPLPDVEELVMHGHEEMNILPLCPDAHAMWDRYNFAIRPVEHPDDRQHRTYIQMVWLRDRNSGGSFVTTDWNHERFGGIADFRRGQNDTFPPVRHGDVYELVTTDPDAHPLPSLYFLQLQYGMHKILAGMFAAGALRIIFSDDPPEDQGPTGYDVGVPVEWQPVLEAAVDAGVLDEAAAELWGKAFTRSYVDQAIENGADLPLLKKNSD